MTYLPILQLQLNDTLDQKIIKEISTTAENLDLLVLEQDRASHAIHQPIGEGLIIAATDCSEPSSVSLSIDVPIDIESAHGMLDPTIKPDEFIDALHNMNREVVSSFIVSYRHSKGVSLEEQVKYHKGMIETEVADVLLLILKSCPDRIALHPLFLGDRIDLGEKS
jgi:hypothetical protein